jgi:hypothetical protein
VLNQSQPREVGLRVAALKARPNEQNGRKSCPRPVCGCGARSPLYQPQNHVAIALAGPAHGAQEDRAPLKPRQIILKVYRAKRKRGGDPSNGAAEMEMRIMRHQ